MTPGASAPRGRLLLRLLAENGRAHWRGYALALALMAVAAGATALSAWIMRDVINEIFVARRRDMVVLIAAGVAAIFTVKGAATYGQQRILSRIGNRIVADVQMRLFDHVQRQRVDFFDQYAFGDVATRIGNNARSARLAIDLVATSLGRDLLSVIALSLVMVVQNPKLSIIALLVAPPAVLGVGRLVRRVKKIARQEFQSLTEVLGTVKETAQGARVIRAFGLEGLMRARMAKAVDGVRRRADGVARLSAATGPLMDTLAGFAIAAVILIAGNQVIGGRSDAGSFFAFVTALLLAYDPAKRLAKLNVALQTHLVGVDLMYQLLDSPARIADAPGAKALPAARGEVRFEGVRFRYGDAPALDGVDLTARAGEVTALVGPSGAGKSTVFALIERFYDPDAGRVTIDGVDIREVDAASLRAAIAYVGQDAFLFDVSVRDNIRMGRLDATDAEIEAAARAANAHAFIAALPGGYDAPVGENGARLSGGQRQRIAIARAMLRGAPILLLDEATSALDAESEAAVAEALERLMAGRTTIAIAHRLATVRHAAAIHVLDHGQVVESGTHATLTAKGGLYARLAALQFEGPPTEA
ncbi:MAG: ABC transporter ATP-binding protein [Rhodobacteraceae bacterium]|nr:MAG: ABC transporter ATP-binding protein [Paracoccaceae bacterium]